MNSYQIGQIGINDEMCKNHWTYYEQYGTTDMTSVDDLEVKAVAEASLPIQGVALVGNSNIAVQRSNIFQIGSIGCMNRCVHGVPDGLDKCRYVWTSES